MKTLLEASLFPVCGHSALLFMWERQGVLCSSRADHCFASLTSSSLAANPMRRKPDCWNARQKPPAAPRMQADAIDGTLIWGNREVPGHSPLWNQHAVHATLGKQSGNAKGCAISPARCRAGARRGGQESCWATYPQSIQTAWRRHHMPKSSSNHSSGSC